MSELVTSIFKLLRFFIACKVFYLLYMNTENPIEYPIEGITWWIYFLVLDIWINNIFTEKEDNPK
jgi:hypothetical protein